MKKTITKAALNALKAKARKAAMTNKKEIETAAEVARLESIIQQANDPAIFEAKVAAAARQANTDELNKHLIKCAAIVDAVPVYNSKTRTNRVWHPSRKFYGTQIDMMYQLASGIMFSCEEHRQLMLNSTGLNQDVIEEFVEAFGSPTYYSRNNNVIVDEQPYNLDRIKSSVALMQATLGVTVDTTKLTEEFIDKDFQNAKAKAVIAYEKAQEAISEVDMEL